MNHVILENICIISLQMSGGLSFLKKKLNVCLQYHFYPTVPQWSATLYPAATTWNFYCVYIVLLPFSDVIQEWVVFKNLILNTLFCLVLWRKKNMYTINIAFLCEHHRVTESLSYEKTFQVKFDEYDGAIGFVNVRNVHWKFVVSVSYPCKSMCLWFIYLKVIILSVKMNKWMNKV